MAHTIEVKGDFAVGSVVRITSSYAPIEDWRIVAYDPKLHLLCVARTVKHKGVRKEQERLYRIREYLDHDVGSGVRGTMVQLADIFLR